MDKDLLLDGDEIKKYMTNPQKIDSDNDGLCDSDDEYPNCFENFYDKFRGESPLPLMQLLIKKEIKTARV